MNIEKITKEGKEVMDLITRDFLENRTIHLVGEINDALATDICTQIEYLSEQGDEDIRIFINSPGGSVSSGMAIYDAFKHSRCRIITIATGIAASMGAFLLAGGDERYATENCEIMIHQPLGGANGQASDIQLVAEHIIKVKNKLNRILAENTGKSIETISKDTDRDNYLSAEEALDYGLIDKIY